MYFYGVFFGVPGTLLQLQGPVHALECNQFSKFRCDTNTQYQSIERLQRTWLSRRRMIWLLPHPSCPSPVSKLASLSKYSCELPVDLIDRRGGQGAGEEPNQMTRKLGSLLIIQYSLSRTIVGYCTYTIPVYRIHPIRCRQGPQRGNNYIIRKLREHKSRWLGSLHLIWTMRNQCSKQVTSHKHLSAWFNCIR